MNTKTKLLPVAFSALIITGCSTVQSGSNAKTKVTIEPDRSVQITNVSVSEQGDILNIRGVLRPKSKMVRTVGHIHLSILDLESNAREQLKVEPNINSFMRRSNILVRFNASTTLGESDIKEIRLKHHKAPFEACLYGVEVKM